MTDRKRTAAIDQLLRSFTGTMCRLSAQLAEKFPQDPDACRLGDRIRLMASAQPAALVDAVGPYLFDYRAQILERDAGFFLQKSYAAELEEAGASGDPGVTKLIDMVKEAYADARPADKRGYADAMVELLGIYVDYISVVNGIA